MQDAKLVLRVPEDEALGRSGEARLLPIEDQKRGFYAVNATLPWPTSRSVPVRMRTILYRKPLPV